MTTTRFTDKNFSPNQLFGAKMEEYVADRLSDEFKLEVTSPVSWTAAFDLIVRTPNGEKKVVEVKAANRKCHKGTVRWQFDNSRGTSRQDIVIFLAVDKDEVYSYVVPKQVLKKKAATVEITSHPTCYRGWLAEYREAWHHLLK